MIKKALSSHQEVWSRLENVFQAQTFPQAVLISGEQGVGKKKLVYEICERLLCDDAERAEYYKNMFGKKEVEHLEWVIPLAKSSSNDLRNQEQRDRQCIELAKECVANPFNTNTIEKNASISVHQIRDLQKRLGFQAKGKRIIVMYDVEKMNVQAANAFLKTLEDVPKNHYFILTTSAKSALLPTIKSRCLTLSVDRNSEEDLQEVLQEFEFSTENASVLQMLTDGSIGKSMDYLENDYLNIREQALTFLESVLAKDALGVIQFSESTKMELKQLILLFELLVTILWDLHLFEMNKLKLIRNKDLLTNFSSIKSPLGAIQKLNECVDLVKSYQNMLMANTKKNMVLTAFGLELISQV